jgi:hypothetical protein
MRLTIAYITNRKNPRFHWFIESLTRQVKDGDDIDLIVVDSWLWNLSPEEQEVRRADFRGDYHYIIKHVPPKPNIWQGPTRLTKADWWAASNARNTAICLAQGDYLMFVDDLSLLCPTWLDQVRHAVQHKYALAGAYQKVKNMVVKDGLMVSFEDFPQGHDHRLRAGFSGIVPCAGGWFYGCSCGMPLETWLDVNGYDELADSLSSEDYLCGIRINKLGIKMYYNNNALTYESEEAHFEEGNKVIRSDFKGGDGRPNKDWGHHILSIVNGGTHRSHGTPDLRLIRTQLTCGEPFPIPQNPQHHPYTGVLLSELEPQ